MDDVAAGGATLVDARSPARFAGDEEPIDPRAGHIPGARNRPYTANLDQSGRFLNAERLRRVYAGIGAEAPVVVYCGSGVSACHDLLALEAAGLGSTARLYPGSWSQWSSDPDRPLATGADRATTAAVPAGEGLGPATGRAPG
jgi:thiosulfate/3-mercaptopyruvate sulfurtransferase